MSLLHYHNSFTIFFQVDVSGDIKTLSNAFTSADALSPSVSSITPNPISVVGGAIIINGAGFNNGGMMPIVSIAGKHCLNMTFTDTVINCVAPDNSAGQQRIAITVPGRGGISMNTFEHILRLSNVNINDGSMLGGTALAINGEGFGENVNDISVMIGEHPSKVITVTDTTIQVETGAASKTICLDNSAADEGMNIFLLY